MNIAINRAEIVKGIMLGNATPAYTFIDPKTLDFADVDQGHHQGGRRDGRRSCSTKPAGRSAATASATRMASSWRRKVLFTQVSYFPRVSEAIQGYMRKIGIDWNIVGLRLDHRAGQDGGAGLTISGR